MKSVVPYYLLVLVLWVSCKTEPINSVDAFDVTVRLAEEPLRLNPILATNSSETQILNYVFSPLAEYEPYTLEYLPVLVESLDDKEILGEADPFGGELIYSFKIREDAVWHDGAPITAEDYLFTAKTVFVPQISSASWLGYLVNILDIRLDEEDEKRFQVVVEKEYLLALQSITNFQIYPAHHYDPENILSNYTFQQLRYAEEENKDYSEDAELVKFAQQFSSEELSRNAILGNGPYELSEWQTGQFLILKKKDKWWGEKYANQNALFMAKPSRLIYRIIADETVAITALKDNQIDLMTINEPTTFVDLKQDETISKQLDFLTAPIPIYYYIAINNQSPFLEDPRVRRAVAFTLDVDQIIDDMMYGTAIRTVGPIHPRKSYYNDQIEPRKLDIERAKALLKESGWEDTNNNGIVDKNIDGRTTEMVLRFFVTQRQLGRKTALIHQDGAAKAGIQVEIVTRPDFQTINRDHLSNGDFELVAAGSRMSPADYDPYQNWHSDNYSTGSNYYGFADEEIDDIIESLRDEEDPKIRSDLYLEFQEKLHEEQGAIFLFSPANLIIVSNKLEAQTAGRRPGFFEGHLTLAQ